MRMLLTGFVSLYFANAASADSLVYLGKRISDLDTPKVMCSQIWEAQDYYMNIWAAPSCDLRPVVEGAKVRSHFRWRDGVLRTVLENGDGWYWVEPFYIPREPKRRRN